MKVTTRTMVAMTVACMAVTTTQEVTAEEGRELVESSQPVATSFQEPFAKRHDQGKMARLEIGVARVTGAEFESSGYTGTGKFAVGWLPRSRLGVHLSGWGWGTETRGTAGAGPGLTFWFDETGGWFTTWSAGVVHTLGSQDDGHHLMLGGEGGFGIQRWVGERWSMGGSIFAGGEAFSIYGNSQWSLNRARMGLRIAVTFN